MSLLRNIGISIVLCLFFLFIFAGIASAQVVINEFSPNNGTDWVELYNNSDQAVDLSSYALVDITMSGNKKTFGCILASRGFVAVDWSDSLNNGGDTFKLKNGDLVTDCVSYGDGAGQMCDGKSARDLGVLGSGEYGARTIDGGGTWAIVSVNTKDSPNDGSVKNSSAICTTPTPTPTPTNTPTATPTSSPTMAPTKSPTPKPSKTPSPTPEYTPGVGGAGESGSEELVLGARNALLTASPTPSGESGGKKFPLVAGIFMGVGVVAIAGSIFWFLKSRGNPYNVTNEENPPDTA